LAPKENSHALDSLTRNLPYRDEVDGSGGGQLSKPSHARKRRVEVFLRLLDGFQLFCNGEPVSVPLSAQRTLAFLALHEFPLRRIHVAGMLWPDVTDAAANGSLRSSIWRLRRLGCEVLRTSRGHIGLAPHVTVDVREIESTTRRLIDDSRECQPGDLEAVSLSGDVLPGWYDDWVLLERERLRQLCMHALESLCWGFAAAGRFGRAVEAGMAAVRIEPLRESAHKALIQTYLVEGNRAEAVRQYRWYQRLLWDELQLRPSTDIRLLMEGLTVR
jgi:DNA-binding SARP family transcriptional activator